MEIRTIGIDLGKIPAKETNLSQHIVRRTARRQWTARLFTSGPSDVIVQDVVYAPSGHTGWHSHPGILLSSVIAGSIEWYDSRCMRHVYNPGDSLTENTETHYVRNIGLVNVHFLVTYVIAHGQPRRIDQPAPPCAASLGLE